MISSIWFHRDLIDLVPYSSDFCYDYLDSIGIYAYDHIVKSGYLYKLIQALINFEIPIMIICEHNGNYSGNHLFFDRECKVNISKNSFPQLNDADVEKLKYLKIMNNI